MVIAEVMGTDLVTVPSSLSIVELDQLLMNHGISGAPVFDDGSVVGMVSKTDVIRALTEELVAFNQPLAEVTVADVMTRSIFSVAPDDDVLDVAESMLKRRIHRVLVCRDGQPVGIATSFDMLNALVVLGR